MLTDEELHSMGGGPGKLKPIEFEKAKKALEDAAERGEVIRYTKTPEGWSPRIGPRMPLESSGKPADAFK